MENEIDLLRRIKTSEPSPYLINKIQVRIGELGEKSISGIKLIPIALGFFMLLMINLYAINSESKNSKNNVKESSLSIYESNQLYYD